MTAAPHAIQESQIDAARPPLEKPEGGAASLASEGHAHAALPEPAAVPGATPQLAPDAGLVVAPEAFNKAEKQLAAHLASGMHPKLTEGLVLTLSDEINPTAPLAENTTLKICLTGATVRGNYSLMAKEVIQSLLAHPAIAALPHQDDRVVVEQVPGPNHQNMMHVYLNLSNAEYAQAVKGLSEPVVRAMGAPARDALPEVNHARSTVDAATAQYEGKLAFERVNHVGMGAMA